MIRADAGGANHWLTDQGRLRNAEFSIGYSIDHRVSDAIMLCEDDAWTPAINTDSKPRAGAEVIELTPLVNPDAWPERTRLIVRRERPHAQRVRQAAPENQGLGQQMPDWELHCWSALIQGGRHESR